MSLFSLLFLKSIKGGWHNSTPLSVFIISWFQNLVWLKANIRKPPEDFFAFFFLNFNKIKSQLSFYTHCQFQKYNFILHILKVLDLLIDFSSHTIHWNWFENRFSIFRFVLRAYFVFNYKIILSYDGKTKKDKQQIGRPRARLVGRVIEKALVGLL